MDSRRNFLKKLIILGGMVTIKSEVGASVLVRKPMKDPLCTLYRSVNGSSEDNLRKVIELAGGIEGIVGLDDVVIIKPNVQWWNQGASNLSALMAFVETIIEQPGGFRGEVIIAENCHRGQYPSTSSSSGWFPMFERNADITGVNNMNDLSTLLKKKYRDRFSLCHWLDISCGGKRVFKPADGPGYVYCDGTGGIPLITCDNGRSGPDHRVTIMTYPIFTTDKGTVVDFKHGVWGKGSYTNQPLRLINFSALNHHSSYCGMTSAVKNYMGITDLSGGPDPHNDGRLTGKYYNFHSFPFNKWAPGPESGMLGKAIGTFMKTIRKADLNITTAEWVGLSSRTDPPIAHTRTVLASQDPVALDYHAAKYILHPNSGIKIHNPDHAHGPLNEYLARCAGEYGGHFNEENVQVRSYDLAQNRFQCNDELVQMGDTVWGSSAKQIMKYFYLRFIG